MPIYQFWKKTDYELLNDFDGKSFNGDYIGTIFFFLSGYWEYIHDDKKDAYGRFPYIESFQYKKNIIEEPSVDILVEEIKEMLHVEYINPEPMIYITHDIDFLGLLKNEIFFRSLAGIL
jgi:hypothetical protein